MTATGYLRVNTDAEAEDLCGLNTQTEALTYSRRARGMTRSPGIPIERFLARCLSALRFNVSWKIRAGAALGRPPSQGGPGRRSLMAQLWLEKELVRSNVETISVAEPFRSKMQPIGSSGKLSARLLDARRCHPRQHE